MNEAKILKALQKKSIHALKVTGDFINTLTIDKTTVFTGNLRKAKETRIIKRIFKANEVHVVSGDEKTKDYVFAQYYNDWQHQGNNKSGYKDLTQGFATDGEKSRYQKAYRLKVKSGVLSTSTPEWYKAVLEDGTEMRKIESVYAREFRK